MNIPAQQCLYFAFVACMANAGQIGTPVWVPHDQAKNWADLGSFARVHDLRDMSHEMAYDETQCNDDIKSGDFLLLQGGAVAILDRAWPVLIDGEAEGFHRFKPEASAKTRDRLAVCRTFSGQAS